ncbi:ParB family chromosome partitioning protein [Paenochrobactrum gallinarii]|uniref:ParB family chromosome partitioning protein n=1 Tax=Paenochrobactrum gallinarii TaxID=643673 RepID=A0A841LW74_9HYPH|nr:ParB/RepB/Spo0J family partition protein [Paenochrobactrum gallinarii]MBB6260802.1 ParB family chromosome partitioning protein [Paenochrobactrum gallinarii]
MNDDPSKKRLGRGLAALIGDIDRPVEERKTPVSAERNVPIEFITRNPRNPRRMFAEEDLADLAQSIREHGVVQPIVVRPAPNNPEHYELIAGERRWRASQRAGLTSIPVILRDVDDRIALEIAIIENVQRADLNSIEEALGYQQLIDNHEYTQADLAQVIGKSRSHVANTLRLLKLPSGVQSLITDGALSAGHARSLITMENPVAMAEKIVKDGLSVRQVEALAQAEAQGENPRKAEKAAPVEKDADTKALEKLLSDVTGMKVDINHRERGGEVRIRYSSLEQLDEICRRLQS